MDKTFEEMKREDLSRFIEMIKKSNPHLEKKVLKDTGMNFEKLADKIIRIKNEILSSSEWKIMQKKAQKKENSNKGFVRLLKYLEKNWRSEFKEDSLWDEFLAWDHDLKSMEKQGVLHAVDVRDLNGQTHKYYKLGLGGFQYLYLRRINLWVIIASIFTILSFLTIVLSLFI